MLKTALRALVLLCMSSIASAALAADRVALVIGNGRYQFETVLATPANNASDMGQVLGSLGFEVISGTDLAGTAMDAKIAEFREKARNAKVALFFYSGHGMELQGENFLLPVDYDVQQRPIPAVKPIDVLHLMESLSSGRRSGIVIVDASRPNLMWRKRMKSRDVKHPGLAAIVPAANMLVVHDAGPGEWAMDTLGRNSPFTAALLRLLPEKGLEIGQVVQMVRADVYIATQGEQRPWSASSLTADLYLNGPE